MNINGEGFVIRPVSTGDLESVLDVYRQCEDFLALGPVPRASMEMVLKDVETSQCSGGIFCGIVNPQGRIIGVIDFIPSHYEGNPHHAYLALLMIAAPWRDRGLGSRVLAQLEAHIQQDPAVEMLLAHVQINNPAAIRFWQRHSFDIISEPQAQPDGTMSVALSKKIKPG